MCLETQEIEKKPNLKTKWGDIAFEGYSLGAVGENELFCLREEEVDEMGTMAWDGAVKKL